MAALAAAGARPCFAKQRLFSEVSNAGFRSGRHGTRGAHRSRARWRLCRDSRRTRRARRRGTPPSARDRQDFGGAYVLPGAIDAQVHSRTQSGQGDFLWSTRAAAAGGVTTIVDMPYDDGLLISTGERIARKAEEAGAQARVDFALYGTVAPEDGAEHIAGDGRGRRERLQVLDLQYRPEAFSAHPAADLVRLLRRDRPAWPRRRRAQRERRNGARRDRAR